MRKNGFTLVELLVTISVIGIAAGAILVMINPFQQTAKVRDAQRKIDLRNVANALEQYNALNGSYPSTEGATWTYCDGFLNGWKEISGPNGWVPNLAPLYMKVLPLDPKRKTDRGALTHSPTGYNNAKTFCYIYISDGKDYKVANRCATESEQANSGHPFYKGHDYWDCPSPGTGNWAYGIYTPGAQSW